MIPWRSTGGSDHEARHVREEHERDVERVAQPDEPCGLVGGVDEQDAALLRGLVRDDPNGPAFDPSETGDQLLREVRLDLEERCFVDQIPAMNAYMSKAWLSSSGTMLASEPVNAGPPALDSGADRP